MPSPYSVSLRFERSRRRRWALRLVLPAVLALTAIALAAETRRLERYAESPFPLAPTRPYFASPVPGWAQTGLAHEPAIPIRLELGQTVGQVLDGLGLPPRDAQGVIAVLADHADLRRLRPADSFEAQLDEADRLRRFALLVAGKGRVEARRVDGGGWEGSWRPYVRSERFSYVAGELHDSLEEALVVAGAEGMLAYRMSDVLQWDLDFNRDLRRGDRFAAVYQRVYLDGRFDAVGEILALQYENRGRKLEAYRFGDPPGYYDGEGRPMRKMFLRSPLRFSRITSRFSHRRFHPVLKSYRPHYGVDYGAPTGTPVRVTGNGVVVSARWEKGGGRTVKVRHPNGYLTAYLHLSRFAASARPGRRVQQGELIGYVGSTGLSTAPHLDYRVQRDGRWVDPLSIKSIPTEPLPADRLAEFEAWRDALRRSLATGSPPERPAVDLTADALRGRSEVAAVAGGV